eukprot:gene4202-7539_t
MEEFGLSVCTSSVNLFRRGFNGTISAFGLPNFGKFLKFLSIPLGLISMDVLGGYCIAFGIAVMFFEMLVFYFFIKNYLIRGVVWLIAPIPCFFVALGGVPGVLSIVYGILYIFCWMRYESGEDSFVTQIYNKLTSGGGGNGDGDGEEIQEGSSYFT